MILLFCSNILITILINLRHFLSGFVFYQRLVKIEMDKIPTLNFYGNYW